ncbi:MAG TPA: PQQ-dependent sugar dehydrogenase, partial [Candidatus Eisenbacteria bacterium]|nr:PQQ-dependent sugar dehydrogenase [Candidatus Eisenbacteria bacterium]
MPRPSPLRAPLLALVPLALALAAAPPARAQNWLPGFDLQNPAPTASFNLPTQVAFLPDGRWLVAEKAGVVWILTGGIKSAKPLWDGQAEVLSPFDRGLLSIAVDPNYFVNHYVYFLYTVDPDSNNTDTSPIAFGRLTRYQVSFVDSTKLVTGSRTILMGTGWSDSPLELSTTHSIGTLRFARDGTLLVSSGEGARFDQVDNGGLTPQAFAPGMAPPAEDIGAFRAQDVNSLNGKILRLDPATGHGVASNPFWDGDGTHKRSKVWCYGLRNPFRFTIKPGTGSTNPAAGQPGELYIG